MGLFVDMWAGRFDAMGLSRGNSRWLLEKVRD